MVWGNIGLCLVKIGRKIEHKHALHRKQDFPDYKNIHLVLSKHCIFPKGLSDDFVLKLKMFLTNIFSQNKT